MSTKFERLKIIGYKLKNICNLIGYLQIKKIVGDVIEKKLQRANQIKSNKKYPKNKKNMLKMERKKKQTNLEEPYKPGVIFKTCNM